MPKDTDNKKIQVITYSGYKANERPLHFLVDGEDIKVREIVDRWYGEDHDFFKVVGDDGHTYVLKWHRSQGEWML